MHSPNQVEAELRCTERPETSAWSGVQIHEHTQDCRAGTSTIRHFPSVRCSGCRTSNRVEIFTAPGGQGLACGGQLTGCPAAGPGAQAVPLERRDESGDRALGLRGRGMCCCLGAGRPHSSPASAHLQSVRLCWALACSSAADLLGSVSPPTLVGPPKGAPVLLWPESAAVGERGCVRRLLRGGVQHLGGQVTGHGHEGGEGVGGRRGVAGCVVEVFEGVQRVLLASGDGRAPGGVSVLGGGRTPWLRRGEAARGSRRWQGVGTGV